MDCIPPGSSARFPRQESWSGLPFPSPGDPPDPGIEPHLLHWQAASLPCGKHIIGGPALSAQQHPAEESQGPRLMHWLTPAFSSSERSRSGVPHPSGHHKLNKITSVLTAASLRIEAPVTIHEGAQYPPGRLPSASRDPGALCSSEHPAAGRGGERGQLAKRRVKT